MLSIYLTCFTVVERTSEFGVALFSSGGPSVISFCPKIRVELLFSMCCQYYSTGSGAVLAERGARVASTLIFYVYILQYESGNAQQRERKKGIERERERDRERKRGGGGGGHAGPCIVIVIVKLKASPCVVNVRTDQSQPRHVHFHDGKHHNFFSSTVGT